MKNKTVSSKVVLKSGIWYTVSNFMFRAVAFITTPIFARMLSKAEYGEFNNISSWISILFVLTSCDLYTSIIRAKLDYPDDIEQYGFSVLTLGSLITAGEFLVIMFFRNSISEIMGIEERYLGIMFAYLFFVQGYYVFITIERAHYRYKTFSILTGVGIISSCMLSVLLIMVLENKLNARVYGQYLPYILLGIILYILVARKGKQVQFAYYKYSLLLSLPMIPHLLSMTVLSSSDRIMIAKLCGSEYVALYSIAYIVANIIAILIDSMNKAWAPWFLDLLKNNDKKTIRKIARPYFGMFLIMILGIILVAPEIVYILGGEAYIEGIYVLPPLIIGCAFQFAYTMYAQVEFYEKRMKMVAIGTSVAALVNIGLNYVLLPIFGYVVAGYTTLIGYALLFTIHYITIYKLGYKDIFERKIIFGGLLILIICMPVVSILYKKILVRYCMVIIYLLFLIWYAYRKKDFLRKFKEKR